MKRALILQHMNHDHPGNFADFFAEDGIVPIFVRLFAGETIPSLASYDMMLVLGGAQDTWQSDEHPWLAVEKEAIREWVWDRAKPYIGICLGHQLLCDALGGKVGPAKASEVGIFEVTQTSEGATHPFFRGLPKVQTVMQWHHAEVQRSPQGARVLATSPAANVQSVAIENTALGTQFHCEFTPQSVLGWSSLPDYVAALERQHGSGAYNRLLSDCFSLLPKMAANTRVLWNNFKAASGLVR
jgi:GMP synthase-like glutamine amidotransferase